MAKRTSRKGGKEIRQNRPGYRKKVVGHTIKHQYGGKKVKIKGKTWEKVKQ